jgi:enterochelin esterase-like enzyme
MMVLKLTSGGSNKEDSMKNLLKFLALIVAVICFFAAGCEQKPNDSDNDKDKGKGITMLDKIFKKFNTFKDENYTPPSGFDAKKSGTTYGKITEKTYFSTTTGVNRKCNVYTPPGYDENETYPVLYLLHGIGGTHKEWTDDGGKPNEIISNLINAGEAKPMIVVMPNVRAMNPDTPVSSQQDQAQINAFHNFINDLRDDLMPFIKENYPVLEGRGQTAIAGLSMGGMESLHIGCRIPEVFGYVGGFSSAPAMPLSAAEMTIPDEYKDKTFFMLCCGTEDGLITFTKTYNTNLTNNGVKTAYYEIPGVHDFKFWNNGLYHFAQCIF